MEDLGLTIVEGDEIVGLDGQSLRQANSARSRHAGDQEVPDVGPRSVENQPDTQRSEPGTDVEGSRQTLIVADPEQATLEFASAQVRAYISPGS